MRKLGRSTGRFRRTRGRGPPVLMTTPRAAPRNPAPELSSKAVKRPALTALLLVGCLLGGGLAAVVAAAPGAIGAVLDTTATTASEPTVTLTTTTTTSTTAQRIAAGVIVAALTANRRTPIRLRQTAVAPKVTRANFGPVIVIRRSSNRLNLYRGMREWRLFAVATGQNTYPTPLGRFQIVVKWRNPWWYPPNSPWAAGQKPIPPGPDNPLGMRWMGLSAPGVGIHGTPNDSSIGYSVSHGCIRMHIPDAEWLFVRVRIGTPVYIVAA